MADISMCHGEGCDKRENCYRFKAIPYERQSYMAPDPKDCGFYWPIKKKRNNMNKKITILALMVSAFLFLNCVDPTPTPSPTVVVSPTPSPSASPTQVALSEYLKSMNGTQSDSFATASSDAQGNVYVAGTFSDTVTLSGTNVVTKGLSDAVIAKYSPSGALLWAKGFGGTNYDSARAVAADKQGNVYLSMLFSGSMQVGTQTLTANGAGDMLLLKLSGLDGSILYTKQLGGTQTESMNAMAVDSANNLVATGYFRGSMSFGGAVLKVPFDSDLDVFLVKYAPDGTHVWSKNFTNTGNDQGKGLAIDSADNIAICGSFSNAISFGGATFTAVNAMTDAFVAKFTKDGTHVWSRQLGNAQSNEDAKSVAFAPNGSLAVTGLFLNPVDFGGGLVTSNGTADGYLAVYNPDGSYQWAKAFGGTNNDYANAVAADASGYYVTGYFQSTTVQLTGLSAQRVGQSDTYLLKLSPTGTALWAKSYGVLNGQIVANSVVIAAPGFPVLAGYYTQPFSGLTNAGAADGFVMQIKE